MRHALGHGNEARAHVHRVGPAGNGTGHAPAVADAATDHDGAVKKLAQRTHKSEGRQKARMPARTCADAGQAVRARCYGLLREADSDDIGQHDAAVGMHHVNHWLGAAQRGHHDGRLVFGDQLQVLRQACVTRMRDEVGAPGADGGGALLISCKRKAFGDLAHPFIELFNGPRVRRGEGPDDARLARGQHQLGAGDEEHRRGHDRQAQMELSETVHTDLFRRLEARNLHRLGPAL